MPTDHNTVMHIDMNSFFAAVEQASNPMLSGKAIIICGKGRTVAATASYEARKYGVRTGMTLREAKRLCPSVIAVCGNHSKYVDAAHRFHEICNSFTERMEVFSIDEVFMDIGKGISPSIAYKLSKKIKDIIKKELGISCSIGIAGSRVLAKLASGKEKPDGLFIIGKDEEMDILKDTPVECLCGIGGATARSLNKLGIYTAYDLGNAKQSELLRCFGFSANLLKAMGRGEDMERIGPYSIRREIKSVGHSCTLPRDSWDPNVVKSFLLVLSERVGRRMRSYSLTASVIRLVVRYSDFTSWNCQKRISADLKYGMEIYRHSDDLLGRVLPFRKAVRLVGVSLCCLKYDEGQSYLFDNDRSMEAVTAASDLINNKYGFNTIRPLGFDIAAQFNRRQIDVPAMVHGFIKEF